MVSRLRNVAAPDCVAKVLRAELAQGLVEQEYMQADLEDVCDSYSRAMVQVLRTTPRPTKELLRQAATLAFPKCPHAVLFSERLYAAFQYCRGKAKNLSTGVRLKAGVRAVAKYMIQQNNYLKVPDSWESPISSKSASQHLKASKLSLGTKLKRSVLKRMISSPSSVKAKIVTQKVPATSSMPLSRAAILASYADFDQARSEVVEILDSQDDSKAAALPKQMKLQHLDRSTMTMVRVFADGTRQEAEMKPSSSGFCVAIFPGEDAAIATEVPNLHHESLVIQKKPASQAAAVRKKPAALLPTVQDKVEDEDNEEGEEENPKESDACAEPSPDATFVVKYSNPYRYPNGSWAIRRRFTNGDKKQIFQVNFAGWSDSRKQKLCLTALEKLSQGVPESDVISFVKSSG